MPFSPLYGYYDSLVRIHVLGRTVEVPEGIPLIRAFQYIELELKQMRTDWERFCWNNTNGCCELLVREPGAPERRTRACRLDVCDGLEIVTLMEGSQWVDEPPA